MIPIIVFSASMLVYVLTMAPTLSFFDSGELISGSYTLGVSHPPGYPVYVTLGKLFTLIPLSNVAFRVNLMSSFFAAMTSVMIYYITRAMLTEPMEAPPLLQSSPSRGEEKKVGVKSIVPDAAGVFSALAFSFSYNLWAWAVVSKFYTLNAFVVSTILMLLIRWRRARREEGDRGWGHSVAYIYILSFICGMAAVVHISQFALFPTYLLYLLIVDGRVFLKFKDSLGKGEPDALTIREILKDAARPVSLLIMAASAAAFSLLLWFFVVTQTELGALRLAFSVLPGAFLGLLTYMAVRRILRLRTLLIMVFFFILGHSIYLYVPLRASQDPLIDWGTAINYARFKWVYNREGYPVAGGTRNLPLIWAQLKSFDLVREFTWFGIPLIFGGLIGHLKKDWRHFAVLLFGALSMTAVIIIMNNPPLENIFLLEQFYIPVYIFLCVGMGGVAYLLLMVRGRRFYAICLIVSLVLFFAYPLNQLKAHYWKNDRSRNFIAYDMGNAELTFAPEFSVLFTWGDSGAFPMWYLQDVEKKRPDVLLVHTPHLPLDWFLASIRRGSTQLGDKQAMEDYRKLRDYNGIKGVEQILAVPDDFRDPAQIIEDIIKFNPGREYSFDYSSRYSIPMPYNVYPYGITYRSLSDNYVNDNLAIWRYLVTRGLPQPSIALDLDEIKAVSIYGYIRADLGKKYLAMGLEPLAEQEFTQAVRYAPELWESLGQFMK